MYHVTCHVMCYVTCPVTCHVMSHVTCYVLCHVIMTCHVTCHVMCHVFCYVIFIITVTEKEVANGLLKAVDPDLHCIWLKRTIKGIEDMPPDKPLSRFRGTKNKRFFCFKYIMYQLNFWAPTTYLSNI